VQEKEIESAPTVSDIDGGNAGMPESAKDTEKKQRQAAKNSGKPRKGMHQT